MFSSSFIYRSAFIGVLLAMGGAFAGQSAQAQGFIKKDNALPDSSRFYMSRMQVQIIDESPIVNHQMNPPGSAGANQIPGVPQGGLPRAGFQSYGSSIPSLSTTLPRTNNGVPSKMPPGHAGGPTGAKAKAGKLGPNAKKSASAPQMSTSPVQAYAPYKGWNPNELAAPQTTSTQKNVRGVLHWARAQH